MKKILEKFKSNKAFTMQDLAIGIIVLILFAGTIGGSYLSVYKVQADTKLNAVASLYAIQILENINKIDYEQVVPGMEEHYKTEYQIPDSMNLNLEINKYNEEDTIKKVKLTITYEFSGTTQNLVLEEIKVKEV